MPGNGIAIQISVAVEHPLRLRRTFTWPPQVSRARVAGLEGLPTRIGVYQASSRVGKKEVLLMVFFGRAKPSVSQVRRANAALRRARLS